MEPILGQIQSFGFTFAPRGWALCDGQLLPINQNQSLYSLLGTIYGGDGRTTFALPDLRGRLSFGFSGGPGTTEHAIGQKGGSETVTLQTAQLPVHNHSANVVAEPPNQTKPGDGLIATPSPTIYSDHAAPDAVLKASTIVNTGGGQSHDNMQPYIVISWCIALQGTFPPRN